MSEPTAAPAQAAPPVPPLAPGDPPLAILVDFDGTISLTDVGDVLLAEHTPAVWEAEAAAYDAGLAGSRRLKILYATHTPGRGDTPGIEIVLFVNDPSLLPDSWRKFLENVIRAEWPCTGVPIRFIARGRPANPRTTDARRDRARPPKHKPRPR